MAHFYRIENASGASVTLCDYGASVISLLVPDRQKQLRDVVLGYAHVKGYETGGEYFGETVGRYCNRICHGQFTLNGQQIQLNCNEGKNHLHGGYHSLSRRIWQAECSGNSVAFTTESPDGEEHYPGNLQVTVTYTFDDTNYQTEAAVIGSVISEYTPILQNGLCGSEEETKEYLDEFLAALDAAGMNEVIEANQAQLDAWLTDNSIPSVHK